MPDEFVTLDQLEREATGGGGIVGLIDLSVGYKCFISGVSNEESFFAFRTASEKTAALAAAKVLIAEHISGVRPQLALQQRVFLDKVKRPSDVTWQGDRFFVSPLWTPAYKEVIRPALDEINLRPPAQFWGRITFAADPSGRTRENQEGETVAELVAYPIEVYASEDAAVEAANGEGTAAEAKADTEVGVPTAWAKVPQLWAQEVEKIKAAVDTNLPTPALAAAVEEYITKTYGDNFGATAQDVLLNL